MSLGIRFVRKMVLFQNICLYTQYILHYTCAFIHNSIIPSFIIKKICYILILAKLLVYIFQEDHYFAHNINIFFQHFHVNEDLYIHICLKKRI